jgi:hypothetical protein
MSRSYTTIAHVLRPGFKLQKYPWKFQSNRRSEQDIQIERCSSTIATVDHHRQPEKWIGVQWVALDS